MILHLNVTQERDQRAFLLVMEFAGSPPPCSPPFQELAKDLGGRPVYLQPALGIVPQGPEALSS